MPTDRKRGVVDNGSGLMTERSSSSSDRHQYSDYGRSWTSSGYHSSGEHSSSMRFSSSSVGRCPPNSSRGLIAAASAAHLMNEETRFPTAMSYTSDAHRSDVATVCSGSVAEDIEVESIVSGDMNHSSFACASTSPTTIVKPAVGAGTRMLSSLSQQQQRHATASNDSGEGMSPVVPRKGTGLPSVQHNQQQPSLGPPISLRNIMGPPLSRAFLHQEGPSSQANSVKSSDSMGARSDGGVLVGSLPEDTDDCGASLCSDVVVHVDTDDCGGSIDFDSVHSQEDNITPAINNTAVTNDSNELVQSDSSPINPLLCSDSNSDNTNGRTSPGGTIYKGRGVRRYQGRYMHLPLKRFHQNGVDLATVTKDCCDDIDLRNINHPEPEHHRLNNNHYTNNTQSQNRSYDARQQRSSSSRKIQNLYNSSQEVSGKSNGGGSDGDSNWCGGEDRHRRRSRSRSRERGHWFSSEGGSGGCSTSRGNIDISSSMNSNFNNNACREFYDGDCHRKPRARGQRSNGDGSANSGSAYHYYHHNTRGYRSSSPHRRGEEINNIRNGSCEKQRNNDYRQVHRCNEPASPPHSNNNNNRNSNNGVRNANNHRNHNHRNWHRGSKR